MSKHIKVTKSKSQAVCVTADGEQRRVVYYDSRCLACNELHTISNMANAAQIKAHNTFVANKHRLCAIAYNQRREKAEQSV